MRSILIKALLALLLSASAAFAADPLPSWHDGPAKQAVVGFVEKVTQEGSPAFVPPPRNDRFRARRSCPF
jgi:hypothetical protein